MAAQGDVLFIRVGKLPEGVRPTEDRTVAHSETGHNHVAVGDCVLYETDNPLVAFLEVKAQLAKILHQRPFDTHEALGLPEGLWEIHRQAEPDATPAGWRVMAD
jgi:hypothetical protein